MIHDLVDNATLDLPRAILSDLYRDRSGHTLRDVQPEPLRLPHLGHASDLAASVIPARLCTVLGRLPRSRENNHEGTPGSRLPRGTLAFPEQTVRGSEDMFDSARCIRLRISLRRFPVSSRPVDTAEREPELGALVQLVIVLINPEEGGSVESLVCTFAG